MTSSSQQAPDYRLYKSEPELTTVKEEVDEANGEDKDKTDTSADSKDATASKGIPRLSHIKSVLLQLVSISQHIIIIIISVIRVYSRPLLKQNVQ